MERHMFKTICILLVTIWLEYSLIFFVKCRSAAKAYNSRNNDSTTANTTSTLVQQSWWDVTRRKTPLLRLVNESNVCVCVCKNSALEKSKINTYLLCTTYTFIRGIYIHKYVPGGKTEQIDKRTREREINAVFANKNNKRGNYWVYWAETIITHGRGNMHLQAARRRAPPPFNNNNSLPVFITQFIIHSLTHLSV